MNTITNEEKKWAEICELLFNVGDNWGRFDIKETFDRLEELGYTHDLDGNNLKEHFQKQYKLYDHGDEDATRENVFRRQLRPERDQALCHLLALTEDEEKLKYLLEEYELPWDFEDLDDCQ